VTATSQDGYSPAAPTAPADADRSLGELVSKVTADVSALLSTQIELAKVELKDEVTTAGKGAGMLGGAALAGWLALIFLSFAVAWLLDEVMHTALAFLLVAVAYGIGAAVLAQNGRRRLTEVEPLPETRQSIKEDVQWARAQKS
jgi:uncharacterized membrane protein YqjE